MQNRQTIYRMAAAGIFAALVFLTTAYLFHVPIGANGGYIHFGDSMIFLAASLLPPSYAMTAAAIGAGLSDLLAPGGVVWVLPTILIKPMMTLAFRRGGDRILSGSNLIAMLAGGLVNTVGYLAAGALIMGSWAAAAGEVPFSLLQFAGSAAFYLASGLALDRAGFKRRFIRMEGKR